MAISRLVRFEVFKRDNFTCQYCGRKTPDVILEPDHVVPISKGGNDEMSNLKTSCMECNSGKAGHFLHKPWTKTQRIAANSFTTVKLLAETLRLTKLNAAMTGEKMYAVLHRLVTAEHARIQKRQK